MNLSRPPLSVMAVTLLVAVGALAPARLIHAAPLPNCTIDFNPPDCPDLAPECGATFTGGDGCVTVGIQMCYSTGSFSMLIADGNTLTITFADDVNRLKFLFAHQGAAAAGTMDFFDAMDQPVGATHMTTGDCTAAHAPDSALSFATPIRKIEIANTGTGNVWLDTLEINPECAVDADCDDGDPCTIDTCGSNGCRNEPVDCDDNDPCTTDSCDLGNCVNEPIAGCPGNGNGNGNGNANENGNGNNNANDNGNANANGNANTNSNDNAPMGNQNLNDNTGDPVGDPLPTECGEMTGCEPGAAAIALMSLMLVGLRRSRHRRR